MGYSAVRVGSRCQVTNRGSVWYENFETYAMVCEIKHRVFTRKPRSKTLVTIFPIPKGLTPYGPNSTPKEEIERKKEEPSADDALI